MKASLLIRILILQFDFGRFVFLHLKHFMLEDFYVLKAKNKLVSTLVKNGLLTSLRRLCFIAA